MRELKNASDPLDVGCYCHGVRKERYAMNGDTYMNPNAYGEVGDTLFEQAKKAGAIEWLAQEVIGRGLAEREYEGEMGYADAAMILAKAHITWHHICARRS